MSIVKSIFYQGVQLVGLSLLKSALPRRLLLPYHHLVTDEQLPHVKHLYPYKGVAAFEKDLDYLLKHFKPVTLQEVITGIRRQTPLPEHSFLLTFDDGLRQVAEVIAPLLYKKGIPAAFFLNSAFIDNQSLFYKFKISLLAEALQHRPYSAATLQAFAEALSGAAAGEQQILKNTEDSENPAMPHRSGAIAGGGQHTLKNTVASGNPATPHAIAAGGPQALIKAVKGITYTNRAVVDAAGAVLGISFDAWLAEHQPFMSTAQVKKLVEEGFAIGGHSIDHPYYKELTLEEMLRQTTGSVDFVVDRFGLDYRAFAFPHSDAGIPRAFFDRLFQGPAPAMDVIFGTNNHRGDIDPRILHRFNCERPGIPIAAAVKGILAYNRLQGLRGKQDIRRD